jgi:hypothetical protein
MAFFNRFKKQKPEMDDCEHLSTLGDDPDAWDGLDDDDLKQVVSLKFIEYGASQDGSRIPGLFELYRYSMRRLDVDERRDVHRGPHRASFAATFSDRHAHGV